MKEMRYKRRRYYYQAEYIDFWAAVQEARRIKRRNGSNYQIKKIKDGNGKYFEVWTTKNAKWN